MEVSFHDQPDDAKWILENIEPIGIAIAKGILRYFEISWVEEKSELEEAIELLSDAGLINSPQYWKENSVKGKAINGEYAGTLLLRVASYIKKWGAGVE